MSSISVNNFIQLCHF